jgi:isopentenyldiphosphate isomerase
MELLDVVDENNNLTGIQKNKDIIHEKGLLHREIAVFIQNEKGEFLIQKRSANKKQAPNKWCLTTGHVELGEEYDKAAIREVKEELGIEIKEEDLIPLGIFKQSVKSGKAINNSFMKYYFYKTNKKIEDYIIQLEELSEIKYISFNEIVRVINEKDENYVFAKKEIMQDILKLLKAYK